SPEEMIAAFDLPQIGRSPARFDFAKLESLNGHYIRASSDAELVREVEELAPYIQQGQVLAAKLTPDLRCKLIAAMPGLKERAKTLLDLIDGARFLYADRPIALDEKAAVLLNAEARGLIGSLIGDLAAIADWSATSVEEAVRAFSERQGVKLGAVAQPLRAALTGRTTSPGIFEVLAVLGKNESLARLEDQIVRAPA
ncbi:MAG: glutamate--tRNA ligase, partial [Xanthobacteraceae bacterium]